MQATLTQTRSAGWRNTRACGVGLSALEHGGDGLVDLAQRQAAALVAVQEVERLARLLGPHERVQVLLQDVVPALPNTG